MCDLVEALADDVGRLRRTVEDPESYEALLVERLAGKIETLHLMLHPTAAELARDFYALCLDEELSVREALAIVDERASRLRRTLRVAA